ncbi:MAG: hypothetical protein ACJ77N_15550 [Chloroflexota bacterium]
MRRTLSGPFALAAVAGLVAACSSTGAPANSAAPANSVAPPSASAATATGPGGSSIAAASSSAQPSVIPVVISDQLAAGPNRFLYLYLDPATNQPVSAPDRTSSVAFYDVDAGATTPFASDKSTFVWAIHGERGDYLSHVTFPKAGHYAAVFTTQAPGKPPESMRFEFDVADKLSSIAVGQPAPSVTTPTLADVGGDIKKISTDANPDPRFYQVSEDAALAAKKPFVIAFATPAFCRTGQCGPTLDRVKAIAKAFPDVAFINVEPYKLTFTEGRLQPDLDPNGQLQAMPSVESFGIPTEPWVFVVDGSGVVRGSFDTIFTDQEIVDSIKQAGGVQKGAVPTLAPTAASASPQGSGSSPAASSAASPAGSAGTSPAPSASGYDVAP